MDNRPTPPPFRQEPARRSKSQRALLIAAVCVAVLIVGGVAFFALRAMVSYQKAIITMVAGKNTIHDNIDDHPAEHDGVPFSDRPIPTQTNHPDMLVDFGDVNPIPVGIPEGASAVQYFSSSCKAIRHDDNTVTVYIDNYRWSTDIRELQSLNGQSPMDEYNVTISRGTRSMTMAITAASSSWDVTDQKIGYIHITGFLFYRIDPPIE